MRPASKPGSDQLACGESPVRERKDGSGSHDEPLASGSVEGNLHLEVNKIPAKRCWTRMFPLLLHPLPELRASLHRDSTRRTCPDTRNSSSSPARLDLRHSAELPPAWR